MLTWLWKLVFVVSFMFLLLSPVASASLHEMTGLDLLRVLLQTEQPPTSQLNLHNQSWWASDDSDVYSMEHPHFTHQTLKKGTNNGENEHWKGLASATQSSSDGHFEKNIKLSKKDHSWREPIVLPKRNLEHSDEPSSWRLEGEEIYGFEPASVSDERRLNFWAKQLQDDDWSQHPSTSEEYPLNQSQQPFITRNLKRNGKAAKASRSRRRRMRGKGRREQRKSGRHADGDDVTTEAGGRRWREHDRPDGDAPFSVPQLECTPGEDGFERYACPSPDQYGRYYCIDDHMLCDGYRACPGGEDENRRNCMFYRPTKKYLNVLADALIRWMRGH